jgi:branched-chain amino acid transport system ATP-binding protein
MLFGLENRRNTVARTLPYGMQRKVEIARSLTAEPKLLLLDEPAASMNHVEVADLRGLLQQLNARGLSILVIEHDMPFVMNLCHEIYVLDFGALIAAGEPTTIRSDPAVFDA